MAETLVDAARWVSRAAGVRHGEHVLDLATGTGNLALLAARAGGDVIGVDAEPKLLAVARTRAARAGLPATWIEADVAQTTVPDRWAEVVASVFGVMYASDPAAAVAEIDRCLAVGGRVVLASWCPGSLLPAVGGVFAPFLAPVVGPAPSAWGDESALAGILGGGGLVVSRTERRSVEFSFRDAATAADFFVRTAGHVVSARAALEGDARWPALVGSLVDLLATRGRERDGELVLDGEYLLAVASRPSAAGA